MGEERKAKIRQELLNMTCTFILSKIRSYFKHFTKIKSLNVWKWAGGMAQAADHLAQV
jgi:hypothetical protein